MRWTGEHGSVVQKNVDQGDRRTYIRGTVEHISGGEQSMDRRRAELRLGGEQSIDEG